MVDTRNLERQLEQLDTPELMSVLRRQLLVRGDASRAHLVSLLSRPSSRRRDIPDLASGVDAVSRRDDVDDAAIDAVLSVPHLGSTEAGALLRDRGVLGNSNASDALRRLARDGRLIGLFHENRWRYPRFQLDYIDPRDETNTVVVVNRLLDAGRYPWSATSWWTSPSGSLPTRQAPADLLGVDEPLLLQLAQAYAAGPDL